MPAAPRTLCEAFARTRVVEPDAVALRTLDGSLVLTWAQYAERVSRIAAGLARRGVGPGDVVALMLTNRPEFHLVDTAVLHLRATPFSIYNTSSAEQIRYLLGNTAPRAIVAESQFLPRLRAAGADAVVLVDADGPEALKQLESDGGSGIDLDAAAASVEPDDLATLIYTSGTTGPPKGVELTHANVVACMDGVIELSSPCRGDRILSYLPAAHIAERITAHYLQMCVGTQVTSVDDPRAAGGALPVVRPHVFFGVPAVWQRLRGAAETMLAAGADAATVRERLGLDHARRTASGAAPTPPELLRFFADLGLSIFEAWGMSEVAGAVISNSFGRNKVGTVGHPIRGLEVKLADDGELLARGPVVMRGYRNDPERTAEAFTSDGWLRTGDLAEIDDEGYVRIVDRKKEIIINAAGKNMSPANIESCLRAADTRIAHAVAIGDARPWVTALLVLDPLATAGLDSDALRTELCTAVATANTRLSRVEQIKRFRVLPDAWTPGEDVLTPTSKLRRRPIAERYAAEIDELYRTPLGPDVLEPGD